MHLMYLTMAFLVLVFSSGCSCSGGSSASEDEDGASGETTSITGVSITSASLKDANGTAIETSGTVGVIPNSFETTLSLEGVTDYSVTSDGSLVTTDGGSETAFGNIGLACGDLTPTISVTESGSSDHTYTIAVSDAWKYGFMECTLTIMTDEGTEYPADDISYAFRNACAASDDFNAQTISDDASSCWTVSGWDLTITTWAGMSGIVGIDPSASVLDIDFTGNGGNNMAFRKQVTINGDFEMEVYFNSVSGMTENESYIGFFLKDDLPPDPSGAIYGIDISGFGEADETGRRQQSCTVKAGPINQIPSTYYHECSGEGGYYIKLVKSGDTFTRQYKAEGGEYEDLVLANSFPSWQDLGFNGDYALEINIASAGGGDDEMAQVGYIKLGGITVEGQY